MQVAGFLLGSGFQIAGRVAPYIGFGALSAVGIYMIAGSYKEGESFQVDSRASLITTSLSISLDSLGVGFALPAVPLPLAPLVATVACTTVAFTFAGFAFGARLGEWIEKGAERIAGVVLIVLAVLFATEHALGARL